MAGTRVARQDPADVPAWTSRAGLVALLVLAVQLVWRTVVLAHGYFSQDDFLVLSGAQGGWWHTLDGDYAGGFSPVGQTIAWLSLRADPLGWPLAAATVLALQTAATALLWPVLTSILGDRWLRVPLLALFAFSPLTLWDTQWWVLGLEFWGATALLVLGLWAVLRLRRTGDTRLIAVVVATVALAVLTDERAVLQPVVLLGVLVITGEQQRVGARIVRAVRDLLPLWAALLAVVGGYAVLRWQVAPMDLALGHDLGEVITGYLRHSVSEAFGGPWLGYLPAHAYLVPKSWVVAANGAVLLGLAGFSLQRGGASAQASWGVLVAFVVGSLGVLTLTGRADLVASLGLQHRFAAEAAPVLALCLAGALREVELPGLTVLGRGLDPLRVENIVASGTVLLLSVSAAFSTAFLAPNLYHRDDRAFVEHSRAALRAAPQVVLLDAGVPSGVISPWYGDRARASTVLAYAPEHPVFDLPSQFLRIVRGDGSLAPVVLDGAVGMVPSPNKQCGYPVGARGTDVRMQGRIPDGRWVLRLGYYTGTDGYAVIEVAGRTQRFAVRSGLNAVQVVVSGSFAEFHLAIEEPDATLCLADASAGVPRAGAP